MNNDRRILSIVNVGDGGSMMMIGRFWVLMGVGFFVFIGFSMKRYSHSMSAISFSNWSISRLFLSLVTCTKDFLLYRVRVRSMDGMFGVLKV